MAITAREMDELHYTIEQHRLQVDRLTEELNGLRTKLHQQSREPEIRTIEVQVQTNDHFAEIAILRFAKDHAKTLVGKSLATLNDHPDLIIGLLEGRTILVDGRVWVIHVQSVVLGETVHLYLTGEPAPPQPSPSPAFPAGS